jgi:hypothetical protein
MRAALVVLALAGALIVGCSQPGMQAPLREAAKLDEATKTIANSCGYADELTAFGGAHPLGLGKLDASATAGARKLLRVWRRNRTWIYQGETINGIVSDSITLLGDCGLSGAQRALLGGIGARGAPPRMGPG